MKYVTKCIMALCLLGAPSVSWANDRECRQFTDEIRVGGNRVDSYGTACKQHDGTWREVEKNAPYEKGGYFIRPDDSRYYSPNTSTHNYHVDEGNTRVIISDGQVPYVVVDPFYGHRYRYDRDWSAAKRGFYQHHHGPGWQKHWKMHQRTLNGN